MFAKTAEHIDDIAVIRSMYAQVPNHEPSLMLMNCGDSVQAHGPARGCCMDWGQKIRNAWIHCHVPRRVADQG
ncbi:MAG: DUF1501 domain-containing protein [Pirellulaceae bacterium]